MIDISERARQHFVKLLGRPENEGLGIRLGVTSPGTALASCALEFCERSELSGHEWVVECPGLDFYVDAGSARWLEGASIDFEPDAMGGQLNIRAPGIKGETPGIEAGLIARVRHVLDAEINPQLASHGGRVSLLEIDAQRVVVLRFGGGCHGCGMVDVTLRQGVEKTLRERIPEISAVRDATDHASGESPFYQQREGRSAVG